MRPAHLTRVSATIIRIRASTNRLRSRLRCRYRPRHRTSRYQLRAERFFRVSSRCRRHRRRLLEQQGWSRLHRTSVAAVCSPCMRRLCPPACRFLWNCRSRKPMRPRDEGERDLTAADNRPRRTARSARHRRRGDRVTIASRRVPLPDICNRVLGRMSIVGHSRRLGLLCGMSTLPPAPDVSLRRSEPPLRATCGSPSIKVSADGSLSG